MYDHSLVRLAKTAGERLQVAYVHIGQEHEGAGAGDCRLHVLEAANRRDDGVLGDTDH